MVAFVRHGNRSGNLLYVVNADGSDLRVVAGPDQVGRGIDQFVWSPLGDELVFAREAADDLPGGRYSCNTRASQLGIYLIRPDGSDLRRLPILPSGLQPTRQRPINLGLRDWSPDGTRILFALYQWSDGECVNAGANLTSNEIYQIGHDGAGLTRVFQSGSPIGKVVYSPNGDRIARDAFNESCDLVIWATSTNRSRTLRTHSAQGCNDGGGLSFQWLASGGGIVYSDGLHLGMLDVSTRAVRTVLRRTNLPSDCRLAGNATVCEEKVKAVSKDGSEAAIADYQPTVYDGSPKILLVGINDSTVTRVPVPSATPGRPASYVFDVEIQFT